MKVRELIEKLQGCDPDTNVIICRNDDCNTASHIVQIDVEKVNYVEIGKNEVFLESITAGEVIPSSPLKISDCIILWAECIPKYED